MKDLIGMQKRYLVQVILVLSVILSAVLAWGKPLASYDVDLSQTSVSGLSSGAFMAGQFHVAFSKEIMGAGIVAGGPFYCACENPYVAPMVSATTTCMNPCKAYEWFGGCSNPFVRYPSGKNLASIASGIAKTKDIDDLKYLKGDKVYIFSGKDDEVVVTKVVDQTWDFYKAAGVSESNIKYVTDIDSGHAFITKNRDDVPCAETESPYLNNCGFIQSHGILKYIYGDLNPPGDGTKGQLLEFSQKEFIDSPISSMAENGYVFIPDDCSDNTCRIHVVFHGCGQSFSAIGDKLLLDAGYNEMAETNRIIVVYPQLVASPLVPLNPLGCWDFWGYSSENALSPDFYKKAAPQMAAVKKMIDRLAGEKSVKLSETER